MRKNITVSGFSTGHVQGIATDKEQKYMYLSFTTCLVKTDMEGNIIGSVKGLAGHLGCIAYRKADGRVYGSLEFKHDAIGQGILKNSSIDVQDGFYIAIFDVDKIDRLDMDAEADGVMTAVFLKEVTGDYLFPGHRYAASGIDGVTFAPCPGETGDSAYLYVAYGIYGDTARTDNDHQVILRYDISRWSVYEKPLNQLSMHRSGPETCDDKYFVYTGNTNWGIQNLEYDKETGLMLAAVYRGEKAQFPNYPMFAIDMSRKAEEKPLLGLNETGKMLFLAEVGEQHAPTGIRGINFPYGATGMIALGDGLFYFSRDFHDENGFGTHVGLYRFTSDKTFLEV